MSSPKSNPNENAPKAVAAASGAGVEGVEATEQLDAYHSPCTPRKRLVVNAIGPDDQPFTVIGQFARTLLALIDAGPKGVTALDLASWAFRLSHYVLILRHKHGLSIITQWEAHEGGKHARYVLRSSVTILQPVSG